MLSKKTSQKTLEIFDQYPRRRRRTPNVLKYRLSEVILGKRDALHVYSEILKSDVWFVNEGLVDPADPRFSGRIITMSHLAELLSDSNTLSQLTT